MFTSKTGLSTTGGSSAATEPREEIKHQRVLQKPNDRTPPSISNGWHKHAQNIQLFLAPNTLVWAADAWSQTTMHNMAHNGLALRCKQVQHGATWCNWELKEWQITTNSAGCGCFGRFSMFFKDPESPQAFADKLSTSNSLTWLSQTDWRVFFTS